MTSPQLQSKKNYDILKHIDGGGFGAVHKIKVHEDGKKYALKTVQLDDPNAPNALDEAKKEYELLQKNIPNVLKCFGSHHKPNKVFRFSTELMEMDLQKFINTKGPLSFQKFIPIFKDIITGKKKI